MEYHYRGHYLRACAACCCSMTCWWYCDWVSRGERALFYKLGNFCCVGHVRLGIVTSVKSSIMLIKGRIIFDVGKKGSIRAALKGVGPLRFSVSGLHWHNCVILLAPN